MGIVVGAGFAQDSGRSISISAAVEAGHLEQSASPCACAAANVIFFIDTCSSLSSCLNLMQSVTCTRFFPPQYTVVLLAFWAAVGCMQKRLSSIPSAGIHRFKAIDRKFVFIRLVEDFGGTYKNLFINGF